ncbi:hypothetical protein ACFXTI_021615 [Malus domestica]
MSLHTVHPQTPPSPPTVRVHPQTPPSPPTVRLTTTVVAYLSGHRVELRVKPSPKPLPWIVPQMDLGLRGGLGSRSSVLVFPLFRFIQNAIVR